MLSGNVEFTERCIAVSGVPVEFSSDDLIAKVEKITDIKGCVIDSQIVQGGEIDKNLRKWILLLNSKQGADEVHRGVGHDEIQVGGDFYTIAYSPATECEIPLDFMNSGEEMEVDGDPDPTTDGSDPYPSGVFVNWPPPNAQTQQNMPHNPEEEPHLQPNMGQGQSSYGVYATASAAQNVPSQPATESSHGGHGDQENLGQGHGEPGQGQGYMPGQPRPGYLFPNYQGYNLNMPPMGGHYPSPPPHSDAHNPDTNQAQNQEGKPAGPSAQGQRPEQRPEHLQSQPRGQNPYGQYYPAYNPYNPYMIPPYRLPAPHPGQQPYQPHARAPGYPQAFPNGQQWQQFPGQGRFPNQPQGQYNYQPRGHGPNQGQFHAQPQGQGQFGNQPQAQCQFPNQGQFPAQPQGQGQFHNQPPAQGQYPNQAPAYMQAQPTDSTDFSDLPPPYNSSEDLTDLKRPSSGSGGSSGSSESSFIIINSRSSTPTQVKQPADSEYRAATPVTKDSPVVETETRAIKDQDEYLERLRRKQLDEEANARVELEPVYSRQEQTSEVVETENRTIKDQDEHFEPLRRNQLDEVANARVQPEPVYNQQEKTPEDIIPDTDPKDTDIEEEEGNEKAEINKILVSGINPQMTEQFLLHFFESRRVQTVSDVLTVTVDEESETAIVEFESPAAANIVLEKQRFKALGNWISVEAYVPQPEQIVPLTTVEVRGLPRNTSTEFVRLYFESGRIGGGDVSNVHVEDDVMLVEFEEEEVASRVAEKEDLQFEGRPLAVKLHEPRKVGHSHKEGEGQDVFEDAEEEISVPVCTVEIRGIRSIKSKDTLQYYLENARRSGGGELKETTFPPDDDDVVFVTFLTEDVAASVVSRSHTVENCKLSMKLFVPPPPEKPRPQYDNRIIITGLQPTTTRDCLFNFLEAKSGAEAESLVYGENDGAVMVSFESRPDFEKLKDVCTHKKLEGGYLEISTVPVSNCLLVKNLKPTTSQDTVHFYFENKRRSAGDEIDRVVLNHGEDYCLVYFKDHEVVPEVLARSHTIDGQTLQVQVYIDQLGQSHGDGSEPLLKIPGAITIPGIDQQKTKFLCNSNVNKEALDIQMQDCNAKINWPENEDDYDHFVVDCTLTADMPDCRKLVKHWQEKASLNLADFLRNIGVHELAVPPEGMQSVVLKLKSLTIATPNAVAVFVDAKNEKIRIAGIRHPAQTVTKDIENIIQKANEEIQMAKQSIKETISPFKSLQLRMLLAAKYPAKMEDKFQKMKVRIVQNRNEISFEGLVGDIRSAQVQMYELVNTFAKTVVQNIPAGCVTLYQNKQVKDYIVKKIKANQVTGVWDAMDGKLEVCSGSDSDIKQCAELVNDSVKDQTVTVSPDAVPVLKSEQWKEKVVELHAKYPGRSYIVVSQDSTLIHVCCTDDIADEMLESVKKFLRLNTVHEDTVTFHKSVTRLLDLHHNQEIGEIGKQLVQYYVQISSGRDIQGFVVRGTEDGLQQAKTKLNQLARRVQHRDHMLRQPGIAGHMHSSKGLDTINVVESSLPCVIEMDSENSAQQDNEPIYEQIPADDFPASTATESDRTGVCVRVECKASDGRKLYVVEGDMTEMTVDVLVNTADNKLSLSGGLGKVIVTKGGAEIKKACSDFIRTEGSLSEGEVFMSPAGNLKAKHIVHVVGPHWKGGNQDEKDILREAVFKCMEAASQSNVDSIAIPAISCGVFGFPVRSATKVIAGAVKDFFREMQESPLTAVYLCDVKSETIERFKEAVESEFGKEAVTVMARRPSGMAKRPLPPVPVRVPAGAVRVIPLPQTPTSGSDSDETYDEPTPGPPLPKPRASLGQAPGNINVHIVKGEIAKLKVDVIVNSVGKNLELKNGAVSASLLLAGGPKLQQEVSQKYPRGINDGDIAETGGAQLKCGMVLHTALMNWDGGAVALPMIQQLMSKCLNLAEKQGATSIAFPAFGTGNLGYPKDIVAKEMYKAVSVFSQKNPNSSLQDVSFAVYHKDLSTIKAFEMEEKRASGGGHRGSRQNRHIEPIYHNVGADDSDDGGDHDTVHQSTLSDTWPTNQTQHNLKRSASVQDIRDRSRNKTFECILHPEFWLEDEHVDNAMSLIKRTHPNIHGLQNVCAVLIGVGTRNLNPFIQIFNADGRHWVTASTIGCEVGTVTIYDSFYRKLSNSTVTVVLNSMTLDPSKPVAIVMPPFQLQKNTADCGLFAIAAAVSLSNGINPSKSSYDITTMRAHLFNGLYQGRLIEFQQCSEPVKRLGYKEYMFYLCKACSFPIFSGKQLIICDGCKLPCHRASKCSGKLEDDVSLCKNCLSKIG